jgi:hypothetical protein
MKKKFSKNGRCGERSRKESSAAGGRGEKLGRELRDCSRWYQTASKSCPFVRWAGTHSAQGVGNPSDFRVKVQQRAK